MQKIITVFGATGFVGRYVVDALAKQGWTIRVPTRRPARAYALRTAGNVGQIVPFSCDIENPRDLRDALTGADAVVNLIGILAENRRQKFDAVHHQFAGRLAQTAAALGIRHFIHVSALGACPQARSRYQRSKAKGQEAVHQAFPDTVILRPSIVFGVGDGFFSLFRRLALVSPLLPLIGGGKTKFQPVFGGDVAKAIVAGLDSYTKVQGKILDLGGPEILTFRQMIERMLMTMGLRRCLVPVPWFLAYIKGAIFQYLPLQLLTIDQVHSLRTDNVVEAKHNGLRILGIKPVPLADVLPKIVKF